ncbi:hypothetical protein DICVIV_11271 [Dictyocaulus viviparus]|uniref:Uncharacterized protein n=1 Tax=Dictyocaulus viviparus TaxID=29172 RepID=A0A0D8XGA3_DICVI|nr:hypothetical protein DICVIV_11271 [Dictyocaulus viviparus]
MRNELERRRRSVASFGGGRRVTTTDLMIRPLYATHRKAYARELKKNFKTWPLMIAEAAKDIEKSFKHRLLFVENVLRFGKMRDVVKEFCKQNKEWVKERLKITDIQNKLFLEGTSLNKLRPFKSPYHLASELHELPPSVGHSVFFCIARKNLTLVIGKEETVRKVTEKGTLPLTIHPTRYQYQPNAVTAYKNVSEFQEPLVISVHEAPRRAPSVNSLSGFSSESGASTATESPGEWQHNWKMQTMHRDLEHRLMDSSIQNPLQEKELGELGTSQRIAEEVDRRIGLLNRGSPRFETFCCGKCNESSKYSTKIYAENMIKLRRNKNAARQIQNDIKKIVMSINSLDVKITKNRLHMQVIDYVFNEMIKLTPTTSGDPYDGYVK